MDLASVAAAVTPRPRAVFAVHLFGRPAEWEALQTAVPQEVPLLEDAAGALGARYRDTPCGALGVAACLSFHPRKIVTTGEGGAVTTDEAALDTAVRRLDTTAGRRSARCPRRASTTACPTSCVRSARRRSRASSSSSKHASGSRAGTRTASAASSRRREPPRATGTGGRRTSSSSTGATGSRGPPGAGHRGPDRHMGAPPPRAVPLPGPVPGRGPGVRARARAPLPHPAHRGRRRPGRRSLDKLCK